MHKKRTTLKIVLLLFVCLHIQGQNRNNATSKSVGVSSSKKSVGVSVSPAHFHLDLKQGESKTYSITINNDTPVSKSFNLNMFDFNMNGKGKSAFLPAGEGEYSLSKWVNITPTFVELKPREKRKVEFTVSVPNTSEGKKAAWSIIMVELQEARKRLDPSNKTASTVALGVVPTYAFGVFVYQNPPNVDVNQVEFVDFYVSDDDEKSKKIAIVSENKGDGIAYCTSYIDVTNLETGEQERLTVKKFTILPGLIRDFIFPIPERLPKGKYLAVGVLDFENSEEIQAAKMEFEL
ncbi:WxL protein peptidoglycan domain-containing protein [Flavicella sediminum]|uniref:WxL protein peptidoglycan domain-containing protein n=1 Tax=Flavicella sediminum TaxID=2585141 RepID=UPI00111EA08C|nr:DUF916 domain-containing protein [Flavicella sediminum]